MTGNPPRLPRNPLLRQPIDGSGDAALHHPSKRAPRPTTGTDTWLSAPRPRLRSSSGTTTSHIASNRPGPRSRCTAIAASSTCRPISSPSICAISARETLLFSIFGHGTSRTRDVGPEAQAPAKCRTRRSTLKLACPRKLRNECRAVSTRGTCIEPARVRSLAAQNGLVPGGVCDFSHSWCAATAQAPAAPKRPAQYHGCLAGTILCGRSSPDVDAGARPPGPGMLKAGRLRCSFRVVTGALVRLLRTGESPCRTVGAYPPFC